ncbi:MAG: hypothetical protein QOG05_4064 [Streptosporangiaceae bacterium]|nr:hypothetical protein [Streptosporangiaceae bacterium]
MVLAVSGLLLGSMVAVLPAAAGGAADPAATLVANITTTFTAGFPLGQQGAWDAGNSITSAPHLSTGHIEVGANGGPTANTFDLDLYPPAGQALHAGYYAGVQTGFGDQVGHASAELYYGGRVQTFSGDIEIRDLGANAAGTVTRLDLLFHLLTKQAAYNLFGEIRLGEPTPAGHILSAQAVHWPTLPVGSPPVWVTDWLHNTSGLPERLGLATLVTGNTTDFRLAGDTCSARSLPPGSSCSVRVGFSPRHAGPRASILTIPIDGHIERVQLSGVAPAGLSSLVNSGPDYIDQGRTYRYLDGPQQLSVRYEHGLLAFGLTRVYDDAFDNEGLLLTAPTGHPFTLGVHNTGNPFGTTNYGLDVSGHGRGCGSYSGTINIKQLVLAGDGAPLRADIIFTQRCDEAPTALMTGELKWRIATDVTPPTPVTGLRVSATPPTAPRTITWINPRSPDFAYTLLRRTAAVAGAQTTGAGYVLYTGTGHSAALPVLTPGQRYILAAYPVDTTGNIGAATRITVTG